MIKLLKKDEVIELVNSKKDGYIYAICTFYNNPFKFQLLYEKIPIQCCHIETGAGFEYLEIFDVSRPTDEDPVTFEYRLSDVISFRSTNTCIFFEKQRDAEFISNEFRKRAQKYQQDHDALIKKIGDHFRSPRSFSSASHFAGELTELYDRAFQPVIDKYVKS